MMIQKLQVGQVIERPEFTVDPQHGALALAEVMAHNPLKHVPVIVDGRLVGLIGDREWRSIWHYPYPDSLTAADIMNEHPYIVRPDTPVELVVRTITQFRFDCAIVVDDQKRLLGVFSSASALAYGRIAHRTSSYHAMAA